MQECSNIAKEEILRVQIAQIRQWKIIWGVNENDEYFKHFFSKVSWIDEAKVCLVVKNVFIIEEFLLTIKTKET